jgi:ornithine carbamoyltransferase
VASTNTTKHFLDISKFDYATLRAILDKATEFKKAGRGHPKPLINHTLVLIFEKSSTRTRVSFEVGMQQLGGDVIVLGGQDSQMGRGESIADTARVLSRFVDAIMIRTDSHKKLQELAKYATVPVINGLTDDSHPCQIMADIMTFEEHRGSIKGKTIAWVGDGNNVATSWLHAAAKFSFNFTIATPPELKLPQDQIDWATAQGCNVTVVKLAKDAVLGADCVVADTWVSMGADHERDSQIELLRPYQVNDELMTSANSDALFMHCLPAHRGEEVVDTVIDGKQSVVWDEAENRLHAQKGILAYCLDVL